MKKKAILNGQEIELGGGVSLPPGGTTGQVLAKASDTDGDVVWKDASSVTMDDVDSAIVNAIGDINSILDEINGEVV